MSKSLSLPLIGAVVVHLAMLGLLVGSWSLSSHEPAGLEIPNSISAKVVVLEKPKPKAKEQVTVQPKPKPKPTPKPKPKPVIPAPIEAKQTPVVTKPEPVPPVDKTVSVNKASVAAAAVTEPLINPPDEAVIEPAVQEAPISSEDLYDEMLAGLAAEELSIKQQKDQLEQNLARQAEIEAQVGDYVGIITQQVEVKWSRPAELRLMDLANIQAVVAVELLPTGELLSASILQTSGNTNYDQSVLRAIERVRRFSVPEDSAIFEAGGFRRLNITFRPEDLIKP
ncbi:TonB family protein [Reinekea sp.]|uniref:cell envelope integrity protein TolA n=1 Tax=Reinekea sp. TaxID=1970455 RepID=UPI002A831D11|nr:TonB family protein [Reinekea sp.]